MTEKPKFETDEDKRAAAPPNAPKCACFDFMDDPDNAMKSCADASFIATQLVTVMFKVVKERDFCEKSIPFIMDTLIIIVATHIGIKDTVIEMGTPEAQWETERVLTGIEARLMAVLKYQYELSKKLGLTEARVKAMRAEGKIS